MLTLRAAMEGNETSDVEMQRLTKISRMSMWTWRKNPAFVAWLSAAIRAKHDREFELAMSRQLRLAIIGSTRAFEAVARVRHISQQSGGSWPQEPKNEDRKYVINFVAPPTPPSREGDS